MANLPIQRQGDGGTATVDGNVETDRAPDFSLATAELLGDHSGPAMLLDGAGTVLMANNLAESIVQALRGPMGGDLRTLVALVAGGSGVQSKRFELPVPTGMGTFDITLLPEHCSDEDLPTSVLLLARDSTFDVNFGRALVASRQLFKDLVSCSTDFVWETDVDGCFTFVSGRGLLGFTPDELDGRPARDLLADPDHGRNPFESLAHLDEVECWLLDRDNTRTCVRASCLPVFDEAGSLQGVRGVCRDITKDKLHQAALARAQERERLSRSIVDSLRDALTPDEMFSAAAAATAKAMMASHIWILRQSKTEGLYAAAEHMVDDAPTIDVLSLASDALSDDPDRVRRVTLDDRHMLLVPCHFRHQPKGVLAVILQDEAALEEAVTTLLDIASQLGIAMAQAEIQERLEQLSIVDELTGLLNRRGFHDSVGKRIAQHRRKDRVGALLYIDMDHFKSVNDTHGHQVGDAALIALADILNDGKSRKGDIAGRLGGDEFALWLEETGLEGAHHKAEELLATAATLRRFSGNEATPLGISVGIALAHPDLDDDLEGLINRADQALYTAKRTGRGRAALAERTAEEDAGQEDATC